MSVADFPLFDRFCRFISALEQASKGQVVPNTSNEIERAQKRFTLACRIAGLSGLTWADARQLATHKEEADKEFAAFVHSLRELTERHGIVGDLTIGEMLMRLPITDPRYTTMLHDFKSLATDAEEAHRRLGRRGKLRLFMGDNVPPDERVTILAYALRNGMLEKPTSANQNQAP